MNFTKSFYKTGDLHTVIYHQQQCTKGDLIGVEYDEKNNIKSKIFFIAGGQRHLKIYDKVGQIQDEGIFSLLCDKKKCLRKNGKLVVDKEEYNKTIGKE